MFLYVGGSSTVEPRIVIPMVAGSNPVRQPRLLINQEKSMKYVKIAAPWLFRAYIVWSICADLFLIGLAVWYFFF